MHTKLELLRLYIMISLTHVYEEADRNEIRGLMGRLNKRPDIEILPWAFNLETWMPIPVPSVHRHDQTQLAAAHVGIAIYPTNNGSDGRGDEVAVRVRSGRPFAAFIKEGVRRNQYVVDLLKDYGCEPLKTYSTYPQLEELINEVLKTVPVDNQLVLFERQEVIAA
jgi:hypothetical protein